MSDFKLEETKYGFRWGPIEIQRLMSDDKIGVVIAVMTETEEMEIRCTPKGKRMTAITHERRLSPAEPGILIN